MKLNKFSAQLYFLNHKGAFAFFLFPLISLRSRGKVWTENGRRFHNLTQKFWKPQNLSTKLNELFINTLSNPRAIMGHYGSWLPLTTLFSGHRCCDFSYRINTIQDQNTIQDTGPRSSRYRKPLPNRWKLSNGHARDRTPILTAAFTKPSFNFHTTSGPVHTQKCVFKSMRRVFVVIENVSIDSRPHFRFDAFSTVRAKTLENDRVACCDVSWILCAC